MAEVNYVNGSGGSINVCRFVTPDTSNPKAVNQAADATHKIVGVAQEYPKAAPIPNASTVAADTAGDPVRVYQIGEVCLLDSASGWTAGDFLTSDANGKGITTTTAGDFYGAIALTTLSGAGLGQVQVMFGNVH